MQAVQARVVIDVGNSRTKFGCFEPSASAGPDHVLGQWSHFIAVRHGEQIPWNELEKWLVKVERRATVAGSNPEEVGRLLEACSRRGWPTPQTIRSRHDLPVSIDAAIEQPDRVGIDRLLNCVAARSLYLNQPVIVIDSGTATTVDLVLSNGSFAGGAILPGI